ncbi:diaminopimelate epimerase [Prochlorococcus sp. MIT 1300]|uniref:diaminopimelate epimerase n=1 Tax=Prochlorococcus sp. MIT 1300 TaxID=3096218 RepID=UPI002A749837|nr:diaminopimelate epimerase [Prochlorococcus sp. MIT 1300]
MNFHKYQGIGNDFIIIDGRLTNLPSGLEQPDKSLISGICDRHFGVGADGILLIQSPIGEADIEMRVLNSDGTEAEMCGNGLRCVIKYLLDQAEIGFAKVCEVKTKAGIIRAHADPDRQIVVDMGAPYLEPSKIPTTFKVRSNGLPQEEVIVNGNAMNAVAVGMGNPHMIIIVDDYSEINVERYGKKLENHESFPENTNVHFVNVVDSSKLELKVWERGSGITLACGTGACATLVATHLLGITGNTANVFLPGGVLSISWPALDGSVFMKGSAEFVYEGHLDL